MNERIKELAVQAGFDPDAIERMGVMPNAEKFAELLIKECAILADQAANSDTELRCMYYVLTEHFGIKE